MVINWNAIYANKSIVKHYIGVIKIEQFKSRYLNSATGYVEEDFLEEMTFKVDLE